MQRRLNKAFDLTPLPLKKLLWSMLFARRWPFSHRGAQLLGSSTPPHPPPKRAMHEIQGPLLISVFSEHYSYFNSLSIEIQDYNVQLDPISQVDLV